jgi:hypothetical protein
LWHFAHASGVTFSRVACSHGFSEDGFMNKPQHTATIFQFPAHRVVRRDGVAVPSAKQAPSLTGAGRSTPRADIDFSSWYHFAAIKDQDRPGH